MQCVSGLLQLSAWEASSDLFLYFWIKSNTLPRSRGERVWCRLALIRAVWFGISYILWVWHAACTWKRQLSCAVFRKRDFMSTKSLVCSPPALQSCVQMSTWTWRIGDTGIHMWKVKKTQWGSHWHCPSKSTFPHLSCVSLHIHISVISSVLW